MSNHLDELKELNQQGLFPGPNETEEAFFERALFCSSLTLHLAQDDYKNFPFDLTTATSVETYDVFPCSEKLFGMTPKWVPIFFSNEKLSLWQGGCAWIFQLDEKTPTSAFLQLRKKFKTKSWYLGTYNRKELIIHELAHVGRMVYEEPKFEEILAYRSSHSKIRRFLGPLVQSPIESLFFVFVLAVICLTSLAALVMNSFFILQIAQWLWIIPIVLLLVSLCRLIIRQRQLKQCLKKLEKIYKNSAFANHLTYRLTDKEICLFAKLKSNEIISYIQTNASSSFRWKFLNSNYPIIS